MLDYYNDIGFVPVRQDISDLEAHFARRSNLFLQLGIVPSLLENRTVIEFGPGSGDNAIHVASLSPSHFVLVDGHRKSVELLNERKAVGDFGDCSIEIMEAEFFDFNDNRTFDLVWCEGVISGNPDAKELVKRVSRFVAPGGILVLAYADPVGTFSEVCRHALKPVFYKSGPVPIEGIVEFFRPHLASLGCVSRLPEDWVLDTILHPWEPHMISTPGVIDALSEEFQVSGTLPGFTQEWRWYKKMEAGGRATNQSTKLQYFNNAFRFLDERADPSDIRAGEYHCRQLIEICRKAHQASCRIWHSDDATEVMEFLAIVDQVGTLVNRYMPETGRSIADFITGTMAAIESDDWSHFGSFEGFFGRAQHYLSLTRL